jgi:predicted amidohydrolase
LLLYQLELFDVSMQITISGVQLEGVTGDVSANLASISRAAEQASAAGIDLLITPEMFVTGYNLSPERMTALAAEDLADHVGQIAHAFNLAILVGLPVPVPGGVANAAILFDRDGIELSRYHKTHLFGRLDETLFIAGSEPPPVVDFQGVRVTTMICYDVEFPELVRAAAVAGADAILVPTAQMEPFAYIAEHLVRVRAWENQVYVAYINRCGAEGNLRYVGRSSLVAPSGDVLDSRGPNDEGPVVAVIDTDVVRAGRAANPYLTDRRTDLY